MVKKIIFILLVSSTLFSQSFYGGHTYKFTALDVITEPANAAMGESYAANPYGKHSFFENPATLSKEHPTGLFYHSRSHDWIEFARGTRFSSLGISTGSAWGQIAFSFSQYSTGKMYLDENPASSYEEKNSLYLLSLSKTLTKDLTVGASVKVFNRARKSSLNRNYELTSNDPIMFDFGFLYSIPRLELNKNLELRSFVGGSIQNFGQDYKETNLMIADTEQSVRLPRYLRSGFTVNILLKNQNGSHILNGLLTGEYKRLLNPLERESGDVDYWGSGLELTLLEYVSIRGGVFQTPENSVLFEKSKLLFRYGAGFNMPLEKLGINIPAIISFDYTFIPINQFSYTIDGVRSQTETKFLHAVGLSLHYSDFLF